MGAFLFIEFVLFIQMRISLKWAGFASCFEIRGFDVRVPSLLIFSFFEGLRIFFKFFQFSLLFSMK